MAGIRDPAFWKRFSVAVHLDEEQQKGAQEPSSWLARQQAKRARRTYVCYGFWIGFAILAALIVALIYWMYHNVETAGPVEPNDETKRLKS